jgi:hypothetical protein
MASYLRQAFKADEAAEIPTDVLEAAADLRELQSVQAAVRNAILETESDVTGARQRGGIFDQSSPWAAEILGEDRQREMGGGVFHRN